MAILFDSSSGNTGNTTGTITFSHTCAAGASLFVQTWDDGARTPTVTYNGVSATLILSFDANEKIFMLSTPSVGTNTVSISFGGSGVWSSGMAASWTGINTTGQPEATGTKATGNPVSALAASVTTVTNNAWAIGFGRCGNTVTAGASTAVRRSQGMNNGASVVGFFADSNADVTPAGSRTLNIVASSTEMQMQVLAFAPTSSNFGALLMAQMI